MECFVEEVRLWTEWSNVIGVDETNHFDGAFLFHDRVMRQDYAQDMCITDDASCTSYFGTIYTTVSLLQLSKVTVMTLKIGALFTF